MRLADYFLILVLCAGVGIAAALLLLPPPEAYAVLEDGTIRYEKRPPVSFETLGTNETELATVTHIRYKSHGGDAYGLLAIPKFSVSGSPFSESPSEPKTGNRKPAFILLPGAGVTKEGQYLSLGQDLNSLGFATLTLDLRGQGESLVAPKPVQEDFQLFANGSESTIHQQVYDVIRAYDLLKTDPRIDPEKIYVGGESAGGRFVILAAGSEPGIRGVLAISTAGFQTAQTQDPVLKTYLNSINPDAAIARVQRLLMLHSTNDTIIPLVYAQGTFSLANEPKKLVLFGKPGHGYDPLEKVYLEQELPSWR